MLVNYNRLNNEIKEAEERVAAMRNFLNARSRKLEAASGAIDALLESHKLINVEFGNAYSAGAHYQYGINSDMLITCRAEFGKPGKVKLIEKIRKSWKDSNIESQYGIMLERVYVTETEIELNMRVKA
jgi:hypothetical protein